MIEKVVTIITPVLMEYSPDANGRYGLLTCSETYSTHIAMEIQINLSTYLFL